MFAFMALLKSYIIGVGFTPMSDEARERRGSTIIFNKQNGGVALVKTNLYFLKQIIVHFVGVAV